MKIIEMLSEKIEESIDSAEDYAKEAFKYKEEFPEVSKMLITISESEMSIMSSLHAIVTKVINDYRKEKGEPPAPMMAVYEYLHKKHIDNAAKVKSMHQLYKEEK